MPSRVSWLGLLFLVVLPWGSIRGEEDNGYLRYLPSDSKLVVTIHVPALGEQEQKNALETIRKVYVTRLAPELGKNEKLPISDISRIVVAQPFVGTGQSVIIIRGKVDQQLFEKQMRLAVKKSKKWLTVQNMGKPPVPVFRRQLDDKLWADLIPPLAVVPIPVRRLVTPLEVYVAALDDETVFLAMPGRLVMERALKARSPKTEPRISDELVDLLKKQDKKDIAAFVMLENSLSPPVQLVANEAIREAFDQFEHVTGRLRANGKEVEIHIRATGKSTDQGSDLVKKGEQSLKQLRTLVPKVVANKDLRTVLENLLKGVRITRTENIVSLTAKLDAADARKLLPALPMPPEKKKKKGR